MLTVAKSTENATGHAIATSPVNAEVMIERAAALVPELRDRAPEVDRTGRVSDEMIAKIKEAGLYRILRLKRFGGYEMDYRVQFEVIRQLGRGCGSTAWTFGNTSSQQINVAMCDAEMQEEFWGKDADTLMSGSLAPTGKAEAVDGGYRLTGTWGFASGVDHASWHLVSAIVPNVDTGVPGIHFFMIPRSDYTVIEGSWDTIGLRGTGSKDVRVDGAFVPMRRVLSAVAMLAGTTPGGSLSNYSLLKVPYLTYGASTLLAPGLGMVSDAIESFIETTSGRITRGAVAGGGNRLAEFPIVQTRLAEATALEDAARLLIARDLDETIGMVERGEPVSIDTRIRNRRDQAIATRFCVQAADALYACSGGAGLYMSNRMQRIWRDVNSVGKHIALNWDAVGSMYGQNALGLEPKGQY